MNSCSMTYRFSKSRSIWRTTKGMNSIFSSSVRNFPRSSSREKVKVAPSRYCQSSLEIPDISAGSIIRRNRKCVPLSSFHSCSNWIIKTFPSFTIHSPSTIWRILKDSLKVILTNMSLMVRSAPLTTITRSLAATRKPVMLACICITLIRAPWARA